jgi:superfamily II DNA or RNA helicase/HKD family nuclease
MKEGAVEHSEPRLVLNRHRKQRVLHRLQYRLRNCESFRFYVAFVNCEGVASLMQPLLDAQERGVNGRVLVSQYLNFTHPEALRSLLRLPNLEVRIATRGAMHAKGYFFSTEARQQFLIGSSNWTASAISSNTELNVEVEAEIGSAFAKEVAEEFDHQYEKATPLTTEFIVEYEALYDQAHRAPAPGQSPGASHYQPQEQADLVMETADSRQHFSPTSEMLPTPNQMQSEALSRLQALRDTGENKALIVSATGTGKTFLSAFDARAFQAKKLLFVVHRENIARKAMESFQMVFGKSRSMGIYAGSLSDTSPDFIFSTVQTLSRPERMKKFSVDHFDFIIVDESHRAGAASYARFLDYFRPKFLLGMTATPERTDGQDIFQFFDHNIAYEIRLQRALEEGMLCPFHYFGVSDLSIDGELVDQHSEFNRLLSAERVERIVEKAELYGCHDGTVRGLVFCSRNKEAVELSAAFNSRGFRTVALSGANSEVEREQAILALESSDPEIELDYIFTVDIFNEGVDIPSVNQIIMLRPTQSSIVFVQQLGRGMRKGEGEDKYLTVIDFIGNYQNNYLIPIALYGDRSHDKDSIRKLLVSESEAIPGTSTINFDLVTKERIFESLNAKNLLLKRDLSDDYKALKFRLGRAPMMMDFVEQGARDPAAYVAKSKSFYNFALEKEDELAKLGQLEREILEALSKNALSARTGVDPLLLEALMSSPVLDHAEFKVAFQERAGFPVTDRQIEIALRSVNLQFMREQIDGSLVSKGDKWKLRLTEGELPNIARTEQFNDLLLNETFQRFLEDAVAYAATKYFEDLDPALVNDGFVRYRKYSRADAFKILGLKQNPVAQNVGGYMVAPDKGSCAIFVTYHKGEDVSDSTKYEDEFVSPSCLHMFSKNNRSLNSPDVKYFKEATSAQRLPLFVQKNNDEGIEFYYLGDVTPKPNSFYEDKMPVEDGKGVSVVRMDLELDQPVDASLFEYLVG